MRMAMTHWPAKTLKVKMDLTWAEAPIKIAVNASIQEALYEKNDSW